MHKIFKQKLISALNADADLNFSLNIRRSESGSLAEILFNSMQELTQQEQQEDFIGKYFKGYNLVSYNEIKQQVEITSQKAKSELPQVKSIFNKKLETVDKILVKIPLKLVDKQTQWLWAQVLDWKENILRVELVNRPINQTKESQGKQQGLNKVLRVNQQDVFDYAIYFKDGVIKGNSTGELLKQMK